MEININLDVEVQVDVNFDDLPITQGVTEAIIDQVFAPRRER